MLGPSLSGQMAALGLSGGGTISGNLVITGTLTTTGAALFSSTIEVDGAANFDGAADFDSTANFDGAVTATSTVDFNGATTIKGTTTNDSAAAGDIGEILSGTAAIDSVGSWSTNIAKNVTSVTLTAGDWDVWGQISWAGATTGTYIITCISTTSATLQGDETTQGYAAQAFITQANSRFAHIVGPYRASLAGTTTLYLVGQEGFTVGTPAVGGTIRARRVR